MSRPADHKWEPRHLLVVRYLGLGKTVVDTASESGVSVSTIQRWLRQPDFLQLLDAYRAEAVQQVEPAVMANLLMALELQRQVLHGDLDPGDRRYAIAHALINRFLDRLLYVEPAPAGGAAQNTFVVLGDNGAGARPADGAAPIYDADVPRLPGRTPSRAAS